MRSESKTTLPDLPNEILSQILGCLTLKDDLNNVQLVCRNWHAVVDETIGREIVISAVKSDLPAENDATPFVVPVMGTLGFDIISRMGVKTCYIELTKWDKEVDANDKEEEKSEFSNKFKYPHLLQQLYFNGEMQSSIFQNLLLGATNLTVLELNMLTLSQLEASVLEVLRLPNLKGLAVRKCVKSSCREFDDRLGLENLKVLLAKNRFPLLGHLDVRFPIANFTDFGTIVTILEFLKVHRALRELFLLMEFPIEVTTVRKITFQGELDDIVSSIRKTPGASSLQTVEIQGFRLHRSYPQCEIWQEFVRQQRSLKTLSLRLGSIQPLILEGICRNNANSLEDIFLYKLNENGEDLQNAVFLDCRVFSDMKTLNMLYALGSLEVLNTPKLPITLNTLFLTGSMKHADLEYILLELPKLKFLSIRNAFNGHEGYGVSLELLEKVIERRRIRRFILNVSSLCEKYPPDGLTNRNPFSPVNLLIIDNWDEVNSFLDWELSSDNYYITKCY